MKNMYYYLMLAASSMNVELAPEERDNFNKFLRGEVNLAD